MCGRFVHVDQRYLVNQHCVFVCGVRWFNVGSTSDHHGKTL